MNSSQSSERDRLERYFIEDAKFFIGEGKNERDLEVSLKKVGQALFWGQALLEFYSKNIKEYNAFKKSDSAFKTLEGFRFARNRIVHQPLQILYTTEGATLPTTLPFSFFEVRWKNINKLSLGKIPKSQALLEHFYIKELQEKPVRETFKEILEHIERVKAQF